MALVAIWPCLLRTLGGKHFDQDVDHLLQLGSKRPLLPRARSSDISGQGWKRAALSGIVAVAGTEIIGDQRLETILVCLPVRQFFPPLGRLIHRKRNCLANKRGTRLEMVIEPAVRKTGELHQFDNTKPFGTVLTQAVGGTFNDPAVGLAPMVSYVTHLPSVQAAR
ncbi:hypothetical protein [Bradyrhizobium sp. LM6.9]